MEEFPAITNIVEVAKSSYNRRYEEKVNEVYKTMVKEGNDLKKSLGIEKRTDEEYIEAAKE